MYLHLHRCTHQLVPGVGTYIQNTLLSALIRISLGKQTHEGRQHSAKAWHLQFGSVIGIYDQVTTSPEKAAFNGNTDTYHCVNYRLLLAFPIWFSIFGFRCFATILFFLF